MVGPPQENRTPVGLAQGAVQPPVVPDRQNGFGDPKVVTLHDRTEGASGIVSGKRFGDPKPSGSCRLAVASFRSPKPREVEHGAAQEEPETYTSAVVLFESQLAFLDAMAKELKSHGATGIDRGWILRRLLNAFRSSGLRFTSSKDFKVLEVSLKATPSSED